MNIRDFVVFIVGKQLLHYACPSFDSILIGHVHLSQEFREKLKQRKKKQSIETVIIIIWKGPSISETEIFYEVDLSCVTLISK